MLRGHRKKLVVLAFLSACGQSTYRLGESDKPVSPESGAGSGGSANVAGIGGSANAGGSGGTGAGAGGTLGSGSLGKGGTGGDGGTVGGDAAVDTGGACPGESTGAPAPWWGYRNAYGCESEGVPSNADRPPACDGPSLPPIYLAMSRIRLGAANDDAQLSRNTDAWKDIGFDLDKRCSLSATCGGAADAGLLEVACARNPSATSAVADGNQCRDNEFAQVFAALSDPGDVPLWFGLSEPHWNCELHRGSIGIVFRISEYDGTRDDPSVRLDVYSTAGLVVLPSWSCRAEDQLRPDWHTFAPWSPLAHWKILRRSLAPAAPVVGSELPRARYADPLAFVRNGYLVATLPPGTELWLNGGETSSTPGFRFVLHRGILTGALVQQSNGLWTIEDGTLGGALSPPDVVEALQEIGFCQNMCTLYNIMVNFVSTAQDSLLSSADILPSTPCDGLSFGAKFQARQSNATTENLVDGAPLTCPNPKHPAAPRQGCVCLPTGGCGVPDGGVPD